MTRRRWAARACRRWGRLDTRWRVGEHPARRPGEPLHRRAERPRVPGRRDRRARPPPGERDRSPHDRLRVRELPRQLGKPRSARAAAARRRRRPVGGCADPRADRPVLPDRPAADDVRPGRDRPDMGRRRRTECRDLAGVRPPLVRLYRLRVGAGSLPEQGGVHCVDGLLPARGGRPGAAVLAGDLAEVPAGDAGRTPFPDPALGRRVCHRARLPDGGLRLALPPGRPVRVRDLGTARRPADQPAGHLRLGGCCRPALRAAP
jgi:hypothetical protein